MVALIALIALMPTILFGAFFVFMFSPYSLIVFTAIFIFVHTVFACRYHNAYTRVYMTKEGVGNGKLFFKWSEIESFRVLDARFYYVNGTPDVNLKICEMVCIGDVAYDYFWMQKKEKCIYLPLNKKTRKMISLLCENKSETVTEIINFDRMAVKE
jgi:hypothetical protein